MCFGFWVIFTSVKGFWAQIVWELLLHLSLESLPSHPGQLVASLCFNTSRDREVTTSQSSWFYLWTPLPPQKFWQRIKNLCWRHPLIGLTPTVGFTCCSLKLSLRKGDGHCPLWWPQMESACPLGDESAHTSFWVSHWSVGSIAKPDNSQLLFQEPADYLQPHTKYEKLMLLLFFFQCYFFPL